MQMKVVQIWEMSVSGFAEKGVSVGHLGRTLAFGRKERGSVGTK